MKKLVYVLLFFFTFLLLPFYIIAQTPTQEWVARYPRPSGSSGLKNYMALDKVGNCYVAGDYTDASNDAVLIKYNSSGVQEWFRIFQGAGGAMDLPYGVAADSIGNSYITLSSGNGIGSNNIITIKYDPAGTQQWLKVYDSGSNDEPGDIIMDKSGNVYVVGFGGNESVLIKYKPNGDTLWLRKYTQPNYRFAAFSLTLDVQNNVCIGGNRIHTTNGGQEYFAVKYDSNGVFKWVQSTSFGSSTIFSKIRTDFNGNVIVTGTSLGGKIVTIKYNSTGVFQWQSVYTGPVSGTANPYGMKVDKQNNIVINGTSWGTGSFSDYVTLKYNNTNGDTLWVKRYNGTGNDDDISYSSDLDDSNNVYITGRSVGSFSSWDYVTIKYNSTGIQQWMLRYPNSANSGGIAYNVLTDKNRNVYVTGISDSTNINGYVTIKYSQPVGIIYLSGELPDTYLLEQNYPNPFNPITNIKYQISKNSNVKLIVFDVNGKEITTLVNQKQDAGAYEVIFNAEKMSSGIYFYKLIAEKYIQTKKMILIK